MVPWEAGERMLWGGGCATIMCQKEGSNNLSSLINRAARWAAWFFSTKPWMQMIAELVLSFSARSKGLCFQLIQPILVKQEWLKLQKIAEFIWEMVVPFLTAACLILFAGCSFRAVQSKLSGSGCHSALPVAVQSHPLWSVHTGICVIPQCHGGMELPKNEGFFEFWVTLLTEWLSVWSHQHQSKQFLLGSSPLDHMLDQLMLLCTFSLALERSGCLASCSIMFLNVVLNCSQGTGYHCLRHPFNLVETKCAREEKGQRTFARDQKGKLKPLKRWELSLDAGSHAQLEAWCLLLLEALSRCWR